MVNNKIVKCVQLSRFLGLLLLLVVLTTTEIKVKKNDIKAKHSDNPKR